MMTANAMVGFETLFERSVRDSCALGVEDHCVIQRRASAIDPQTELSKRKLVVLNISSYVFRIVALFDFDTDAATIAHLAKIARVQENSLEGQALLDAYAEFANMICGSANRGLCSQFRHAGMSTPFFLESTCVQYVPMLKPAHVQAFDVVINDSVRFVFTICVCIASDTELDFSIDNSRQEESSSGEIELF